MVEDLGVDQVGDIVAQQLDVALERSVAIVGGKPRIHLLVRQPLQLSSLATHPSALRLALILADALAARMVKTGLGALAETCLAQGRALSGRHHG